MKPNVLKIHRSSFIVHRFLYLLTPFFNAKTQNMTSVIKSSILAIVLLLLTVPIYAQISFGLKGGVNVAEFSITDQGATIPQSSVNGFTLGAVLEVGITDNIFIQPEAIFLQKGSELNTSITELKTSVNYLDIPVLLKLKLINTDLLNINLLGGPSFGLALNGEETTAGGQTVDINFGGENGLKRFDLGINAGGGVGINLGSIGVFGDVRYLFGVSNISEDSNREIKNKGLNLSVGLMFKIFG